MYNIFYMYFSFFSCGNCSFFALTTRLQCKFYIFICFAACHTSCENQQHVFLFADFHSVKTAKLYATQQNNNKVKCLCLFSYTFTMSE